MTLFAKFVDNSDDAATNDQEFMSFGVNSSLQYQVGMRPITGFTAPGDFTKKSTTATISEATWTYLTYKTKIINNYDDI
jgi:hypothetical protein